MTAEIRCPKCNRKLLNVTEADGFEIKCSKCGQMVTEKNAKMIDNTG